MSEAVIEAVHGSAEERAYYSLSERTYRGFAAFYDMVTFPFGSVREVAADSIEIGRDTRILDVATGTGAQARAFAERGATVFGVDLSDAMLGVARRKTTLPNLAFSRADAAKLPFDDASFDVSSISFALHEMPRSIRERVVREMARVTKPHGTVLLIDYSLPENPVGRALVYHIVALYECASYQEFIRSDRDALLRRSGIEPVEKHTVLLGAAEVDIGRREPASA